MKRADWRIEDEPQFDVYHGDDRLGTLRLPLAGHHNRLNALAAVAAADHAGVSGADALDAIGEFRGVKRRLEVRGVVGGVTIVDDFAHHPTAFEMTIAAQRASHPHSRVVAVFEPRSNTMKRGVMNARLSDSLSGADRVFCRSAATDWNAAQALGPLGAKATVHGDLDELIDAIVAYVKAGDQVVVMSNGGFGGIHAKLLAQLAAAAAGSAHTADPARSADSTRSAAA